MGTIGGGCACKQVRYEIAAEPVFMLNCHCRDCQQATGSAFAPLLGFPVEKARLTGDVRYFPVTSALGSHVERGFCPNCGSPLVIKTSALPERLFIYAPSLDDPSIYRPKANLWMRSAASWDHLDPSVPAFDTTSPPQ